MALDSLSNDELVALYERQSLPRGLRNNNPGNIEDGGFAKGLPGYKGSDGRFAVFDTIESGEGAQRALLQSYGRRGLNTVEGVVGRWAPSSENDTAGYARFVSNRMGVDPRAPLDMNDTATLDRLRLAMAEQENGQGGVEGLSDEQLVALYRGSAAPPKFTPVRPSKPMTMAPPPMAAPRTRVEDGGLGLVAGAKKGLAGVTDSVLSGGPLGNTLNVLQNIAKLSSGKSAALPFTQPMLPRPGLAGTLAGRDGYKPQTDAGKVMQTIGTMLPNALVPGSLPQRILNVIAPAAGQESFERGAKAMGADERGQQIAGLAGATLGGVATGVRVGPGVKLPKATVADLKARKDAAYSAVEASGFAFPKTQVAGLADDFVAQTGKMALSKSAQDDARNIIAYTRRLAKEDLSLAQMEKLRGDIYTAMVTKGGDTATLGQRFRTRIDSMIDAVDDRLVRAARQANLQYKKADVVTRRSESADLRADKDYGGDYGRKVKDRLFPLIDPANPKANLRGATPEETRALERLVRGTPGQRATSAVAGMTDPRRMGGKIITALTTTGGGAGTPFTGGLSATVPVLQVAAGLGLTNLSSSIARKNMDDLIRLIASGGRRPASKPRPYAGVPAVTAPLLIAAPATARERPRKTVRPPR